jgi:DNA-binding NarL/FixJ family response regulator
MGIRVTLYEDNIDLRESMCVLLRGTPGIEFTDAFMNCDEVLAQMRELKPEIVLMDIDMPGTNGIEGLKLIKKSFPEIEVLMLTVFDDNKRIFESICTGASGYLLKTTSPAEIIAAILELHNGGAPMTPSIARKVLHLFPQSSPAHPDYDLSLREKETLSWLAKGYSYKMIAEQMDVTIHTVNAHCKKIYEKLHVHSNTEAVAKAMNEKIV